MARGLKKKPGEGEGGEPGGISWPVILDLFAYEYGWKLEEVKKLSFRELDFYMEAMGRRQRFQRDFEARIHGMELKGGSSAPVDVPKFTKEETELLDRELEARLKARGRHHHQDSR